MLRFVLFILLNSVAFGATFGRVVPIGGHPSDLALDERRNLVYVANLAGSRIDIISTTTLVRQSSLTVPAFPGSLALSRDGRFLVVAHFGNVLAPGSTANGLTILDLDGQLRNTLALGEPPVAVAFGGDGKALVITKSNLIRLDPGTGVMETITTVADLVTKTIPAPLATPPLDIVTGSLATSRDGDLIYGYAELAGSAYLELEYRVSTRLLTLLGVRTSPTLGPRVTSLNHDGSRRLTGWALMDPQSVLLAQFPSPSGNYSTGSHAFDDHRGFIYAQIPTAAAVPVTPPGTTPPVGTVTPVPEPVVPAVLQVVDNDNLTVRERLQLRENLAGRSVISSSGDTMYSLSQSGLTVFPLGEVQAVPRVVALQEDLLFLGNWCDRSAIVQEIEIIDLSGGNTDFRLTSSNSAIKVSPSSGVTPARVQVTIDPASFQTQKGTVAATIEIQSSGAVNVIPPVRVLINNREPEQRGQLLNIPGKLVDILPDPGRNRFYVLRQDRNEVLVFDGTSRQLIERLRTGNTPMQMAITLDARYLLVSNDNSQIANVYLLDNLQQEEPIVFPFGHYPRSIAAASNVILAAARVAGPKHTIDRIDLGTRRAVELPSLGLYENGIHVNTVLTASPNGAYILGAMPDGNVFLYSTASEAFIASRKNSARLSGAYAASNWEQFVVGSQVLNPSLVPIGDLGAVAGSPSGFFFIENVGIRITAPGSSSPGIIVREDLDSGVSIRPTRTAESPVVEQQGAFSRTLAPLSNGSAIMALTISGVTALPWNYDDGIVIPSVDRVVNAADFGEGVAPGGLIQVFGHDLNPLGAASAGVPFPTVLANSCLTVNGTLVPMSFVSAGRIEAQLPFQISGTATMILRTPGGVSNEFRFTILPGAPAVFRENLQGEVTPLVYRSQNEQLVTISNPVRGEDRIVIFLTGLGNTSPPVPSGHAAPSDGSRALLDPSVTLGGVELPVAYAGLVPGYVGIYQIVADVPFWIPTGAESPLTIRQGSRETTMHLRVVK